LAGTDLAGAGVGAGALLMFFPFFAILLFDFWVWSGVF
jgi:hypothetical protein